METQEHSANIDAEFERGLESILKPMRERGASQEELDRVAKRARDFYASRMNGIQSIRKPDESDAAAITPSYDSVLSSKTSALSTQAGDAIATHSTALQPASPLDDTPYPVSFDEIAELIATGKPIPGIKEIPDKINEEKPSEARLANMQGAGKKPWEQH